MAFGVENLRAIRDSGWIDLKPINILVGKNSSGKSSIARVLPLLRQSSERTKQAPILWYGRLVDFGYFSNALSSFSEDGLIKFRFRINSDIPIEVPRVYSREKVHLKQDGNIEIIVTLGASNEGHTQLRQLELNVFDINVSLTFDMSTVDAISIDREQIFIPPGSRILWAQGSILPILRPQISEKPIDSSYTEALLASRTNLYLGRKEVIDVISELVHGNTLIERKIDIADRLLITNAQTFLEHSRAIPGAPDSWKESMKRLRINSDQLTRLRRCLLLYKLPYLLRELDDTLTNFCSSVSYLEPLRATAERYYRREEISVDELDPKGLNVPFLFKA